MPRLHELCRNKNDPAALQKLIDAGGQIDEPDNVSGASSLRRGWCTEESPERRGVPGVAYVGVQQAFSR